jgi:hypothetical protein
MSRTPEELDNLLIYSPDRKAWPNPRRSRELTPKIRADMEHWLGRTALATEQDPSIETLCAVALLRWHLGGSDNLTEAKGLWRQARNIHGYTPTAENDVNRRLVGVLQESHEYDLAWRTLRLAVARVRREPYERQGYTAFMAADLATTRDTTRPLVQSFATDAERLWVVAAGRGEEINDQFIQANRTMFMEQPGGPVMVSPTPAGRTVDTVAIQDPLL